MKNIVLLVLFSFVVSCTPSEAPKRVEVSPQSGTEFSQISSLKIDLADRVCITDSDCATVATKCSCSCGEGVSKNKLQKYLDLLDASCKNYQGPVCKVNCNGTVKCLEKVCTYVNS